MTQAAQMPEWMKRRLAGTEANPGEIELAPDEAPAVGLFMMLATQWHRHAMTGQRLGLIYDAIEPTARMSGVGEVPPAMFADLQIMENAALDALAERQARR